MKQPSTWQHGSLSLRLLWREWRGGELRLLALALIVAVSASCAVGFFTDRVEQALERQATAFLGADLVLRTARPIDTDLRAEAQRRELQYGEQRLFASMLIHGENMILASIKVVDDAYPLQGEVKIGRSLDSVNTINHPPKPTTLWLEPRLLNALQINIGDQVQLGESHFIVDQLLIHEPDRGGGFFNLRPRAMINLADLDKTQIVQPGSRVTYRYLFNGEESQLTGLKSWLQPQLKPGERFEQLGNENRRLSTTLNRAKTYLNLAGLLAVIMAGIAVAMAARQYSQRHFDAAALCRCMGLVQRQMLALFSLQLLVIGLLASAAGVGLGWLGQYGLIHLLADLVPGKLPPASWQPAAIGFASGLLVLFAAALPSLLRLSEVAPLRVLRRDLTPLPASGWIIYGLFAFVVLILLFLYSQDLWLTLMIGLGTTTSTLILAALAWLFITALPKFLGPLAWRLATANLRRHPQDTLAQLLAFGLTLSAMVLILIVRNDLLDRWESQLPAQAPNNFLINIQPWQLNDLSQFFEQREIAHSGIYPMIRGRLSQINGESAAEVIARQNSGQRAISRELNLTFSDQLAPDNRILTGQWWQPGQEQQMLISVEQEFAKDLQIDLGDQLSFSFGDRSITAKVASIRTLDWGSLRPNFFVIFQPGNLAGLPANYITSFYLPGEDSPLLSDLIQQFPTLTLLEIGPLINNLREIIAQVTAAVEYVLLFVLSAGILVMFSALASSLDERLREGALIRTLGGSSKTLRQMLATEFALLGGLSGVLAILVDELLSFGLFEWLFKIPYQPSPVLWLSVPAAGVVLVTLAGFWGTRRVISHSPLGVLRQLS